MIAPDFNILTGRTADHVVAVGSLETCLHRDAVAAYQRLCERARGDGFEIAIASSFRDYQGQQRIWDEKARGQRPLRDAEGNLLDHARLRPTEIVHAILRWSALPGASRHHWGTEIDIFPANLRPADYRVELIPQEIAPGGVFHAFGQWLEANLPLEGFFRPYARDQGGVSPEWWHLSYGPVSELYYEHYTPEVLEESLRQSDLELKAEVLAESRAIYDRYIRNISRALHPTP